MKTQEQIYKELPSFSELYSFVIDVEEELGRPILNPFSKISYAMNKNDFYIYEGLAQLCDSMLISMMDKPLFDGYSIRRGKDNLPSKQSYADCLPAYGEAIKVNGLEAFNIIKVMVMTHLGWKFTEKQHRAYMALLESSQKVYRILN